MSNSVSSGRSPDAQTQIAALRLFFDRQDERRKREREELIRAVVEVPVPDAILHRIVWLGPSDGMEVLRHHPGYNVDETLSSLWHMLDVFRRSWRDLKVHLDRFSTFAGDPSPFHPTHITISDDIQDDVRKEVFCVSSAAMSLVGTSQKVEKKISVPGLRERISESFANHPEHNFVKELRNNLNHGWFAAANWMMTMPIGTRSESRSGTFTLSCAEILHNGDFNEEARIYIVSAGEKIDVRELFASYANKVESLYGWFASTVEDHLPPAVGDYRRCTKARQRNSAQCWWRIVLKQIAIPNAIDPYAYLDRYLDESHLAEVMSLPPRSAKQVDRIIELVDEHGACDEELRALVYRLFGVER